MLNLATIPLAQFEYLNEGLGVPSYHTLAAVILTSYVGGFLEDGASREHLARGYARARFLIRADSVSYAVRQSYMAELRTAP